MDYSFGNRWRLRLSYMAIVLVILFIQTLPLQSEGLRFLTPDVILAFTFAWGLRRPDAITPALIIAVTLFTDLMLHRPPALWTLIVLAATLFLQRRTQDIRDSMYSTEWVLVGIVILGTFAIYQAALIVTLLGGHDWTTLGLQAISTVVIYPLVTITSQRVFGLYRPSLTDPNAL